MQWKTEHYKLVVTPRYIRVDDSRESILCPRCGGAGYYTNRDSDNWEHLGLGCGGTGYKCPKCMGSGKIEVLRQIPPPPELDKKFLEDLQNWINNYPS